MPTVANAQGPTWFEAMSPERQAAIRAHIRSATPNYDPTTLSTESYEMWLEYKNKEAQAQARAGVGRPNSGRLRWLRSRLGTGPARFFSSPVALGLGALDAGFLIGTGLNEHVLRIGLPDTHSDPVGSLDPTTVPQRLNPRTGSAPDSMTWFRAGMPASISFVAQQEALYWEYNNGQWFSVIVSDENCAGAIDKSGNWSPPHIRVVEEFGEVCGVSGTEENHPAEFYGGWIFEHDLPTVEIRPPTPGESADPGAHGLNTSPDMPAFPPSDETIDDRLQDVEEEGGNDDIPQFYDPDEPNPYNVGGVPQCRGLSYATCVALLEEEGFVGTITRLDLDWENADLDVDAETVVETSPQEGATVDLTTPVEVRVNPDEENMPVVIPAPLPGETPAQYGDRITDLGLAPEELTLPETLINPDVGPNEIAGTNPQPGRRAEPGSTVTIRVNPPGAPPVDGAAGCNTSDIRQFDLSPLAVPIGDAFPFGVFGWMAGAMSAWGAAADAPSWSIPLTPNLDLPLDLAVMQPVIDYLRPVLLIVSAFGLVWMLAAAALKISAPQNDD